jgi:hypothetical protein
MFKLLSKIFRGYSREELAVKVPTVGDRLRGLAETEGSVSVHGPGSDIYQGTLVRYDRRDAKRLGLGTEGFYHVREVSFNSRHVVRLDWERAELPEGGSL